jgi:Tfp pilus assembly protein PilO
MELSKREKVMIISALIILVLAGYYTYIYQPLERDINLAKELNRLESMRLQEVMLLRDVRERREEKAREYKGLYSNILNSIPEGGSFPEFLVHIEEMAALGGLTQRSITPLGRRNYEGYSVYVIDMFFTAKNIELVMEFIKSLEDMERVVTIKSLNLVVTPDETTLSINLEIYGLDDRLEKL